MGNGRCPTNEAKASSRTGPSVICPPIGFGLSRITIDLFISTTCLHAEFHSPYKCIIAGTNILHIDHQYINIFQHRWFGFSGMTVKAEYRKACMFITKSFPFNHIVLRFSPDSVLRAKEELLRKTSF